MIEAWPAVLATLKAPIKTLIQEAQPIATDGDTAWRTPYDECVLVMPSMRHLRPGTTMVRLGRYA